MQEEAILKGKQGYTVRLCLKVEERRQSRTKGEERGRERGGEGKRGGGREGRREHELTVHTTLIKFFS